MQNRQTPELKTHKILRFEEVKFFKTRFRLFFKNKGGENFGENERERDGVSEIPIIIVNKLNPF